MSYIGIDFGTTNTAIAYYDEKTKRVIDIPYQGQRAAGLKKTLPSIVFFDSDGKPLYVGDAALSYRDDPDYAKRCVDKIKRIIGKSFEQTLSDSLSQNVSFEVVKGDETIGKQHIALIQVGQVEKKTYLPEEVASLIFKLAKEQLTTQLRKIESDAKKANKIFITVPANFDDNQRGRIRKAAILAGFEENSIELLNEPEAAVFDAVAKGKIVKNEKVLVFNIGSGTTDLAIMEVRMPGDKLFIHTKAIGGESELGGTDMDIAIVDWVIARLANDATINQEKLQAARDRLRGNLRLRVEDAKIALSEGRVKETEIGIAEFARTVRLTQENLNEIVKPVVERCRECIKKILPIALKSGNIKMEDINRVILTGGPMAMPIVRDMVISEFGDRIVDGVDPMMCVARGAAISPLAFTGRPPSHTILLNVKGSRNPQPHLEEIVTIYESLPADKIIRWTVKPSEPNIIIEILQEKEKSKIDGVYLSLGQYVFSIPPPVLETEYFLACHVEKEEDKIIVVAVDTLEKAEKCLQDSGRSEEVPFRFKKVVDLGEIKIDGGGNGDGQRALKVFWMKAPSIGLLLQESTDIWQAARVLRGAGYEPPSELGPLISSAENLCLVIYGFIQSKVNEIEARDLSDEDLENEATMLAEVVIGSKEFRSLNELVRTSEWKRMMREWVISYEAVRRLVEEIGNMKVKAKRTLDKMTDEKTNQDRRYVERLLNELDPIQSRLQGKGEIPVNSDLGKCFIGGKTKLEQLRSWVD